MVEVGWKEVNSEALGFIQRLSGSFIEEPGSSDNRYYTLTVSEDANAGVVCSYLKHRYSVLL